jgi:hypothetical protein
VGEFEGSRFFTPNPLEFRESTHKGREARFMILAIEPHLMPSLKRSLRRNVKEAGTRVGLKTHTPKALRLAALCRYFKKR